jgi:dTDP-4-dehydrorhamnose reductase
VRISLPSQTASSDDSSNTKCPGAANRFPDKVDKDPEGTRIINIEASKTLAHLCAARDIFLIYISTDYVFAGRPGDAPYEADAQTGPTNLYGQTKLDGETAVLAEYKAAGKEGKGVVLRVPVLYGSAKENAESAVNVLMDAVQKVQQEGVTVKMDHWALRFPTNTEDVARVCGGEYSPDGGVVMMLGDFLTDAGTDVAVKGLDGVKLPPILQFSSEDKYTKVRRPGSGELVEEELADNLDSMRSASSSRTSWDYRSTDLSQTPKATTPRRVSSGLTIVI